MSTFRTVIATHLNNFEDNSEFGVYSGYVDGRENFQKFSDDLRATGYMFTVRSSVKNAQVKLFFHRTRSDAGVKIPFFGPLFQIVKKVQLECCQGRVNHVSKCVKDDKTTTTKRQENDSTDIPEAHGLKRKRTTIQSSKKIGCPAVMKVTEIRIFPDYKIDKYILHGSRQQSRLVKQLREDLQSPRQPLSHACFMINVSKEDIHTHSVTSSSLKQTLHPKLIDRISELAQQNVISVKKVRSHLEDYVSQMYETSNCPPPDKVNRCFYPTDKVIRYHLAKALRGVKVTKEPSEEWRDMNVFEGNIFNLDDALDDLVSEDTHNVMLNQAQADFRESLERLGDLSYVTDNLEMLRDGTSVLESLNESMKIKPTVLKKVKIYDDLSQLDPSITEEYITVYSQEVTVEEVVGP